MKMPEKDPLSYTALTYLWVVGLSSWGGIAGYIRKIKSGYCRFSIPELVGEICIAAFVGIVTFFGCEASGINQIASAALISISGHMGTRSVMLMEKFVERFAEWLLKKWGIGNDRVDRY